tara:strand:+ start:1313 stop:2407 length:1095 start_codon:yes stop_codon:yes gene_type:complete
MNLRIKYYLNFAEDQRVSMNIYANNLINYHKNNCKSFSIDFYKPTMSVFSKILYNEKWKMRYARYISYPYQVKKIKTHDIAHVCDQQYAHLVDFLRSKIKIITVHDIVPIIFKNELKKNPFLFKQSLKKLKYYNKVLTVSHSTKNDIIKYTDCPEDKIEVVMESVENFFNSNNIDKKSICSKYNIPYNCKKILITGNIFYKNNKLAFSVLEELVKYDKNIIFIHIGSGKSKDHLSKSIDKHIIVMPFIKRTELPEIYKICDLLFYPSIYEGFGLPLLEGMSCGLPVVCSNNSSIPEIVGDAALISDSNNLNKFLKDILDILRNKKLYQELVDKSLTRSKLFNENKIMSNITNIYLTEFTKKMKT